MTYDLHKWFTNPNWQTSHLKGNAQDGSTVLQYCHDTGHNLIYMKTQKGWPWDVKSYDANWIYDWITEADWTDPHDFKENVPKMIMCPRIWDGNNGWTRSDGPVPVKFHKNCQIITTGSNSPTFSLKGPYPYNFGGGVGTLQTIRLDYMWSPHDLEQLYLTLQHGWVLWVYKKLINAHWQIQQYSNHNWVVTGTVAPVFPCFPIP